MVVRIPELTAATRTRPFLPRPISLTIVQLRFTRRGLAAAPQAGKLAASPTHKQNAGAPVRKPAVHFFGCCFSEPALAPPPCGWDMGPATWHLGARSTASLPLPLPSLCALCSLPLHVAWRLPTLSLAALAAPTPALAFLLGCGWLPKDLRRRRRCGTAAKKPRQSRAADRCDDVVRLRACCACLSGCWLLWVHPCIGDAAQGRPRY